MTSRIKSTTVFEVFECYTCSNMKGETLTFRIVSRVNKMITVEDVNFGKTRRAEIYVNDQGIEYCYPLGKLRFRPILLSSNKTDNDY